MSSDVPRTTVPRPPTPFAPNEEFIEPGTALFRVHALHRGGAEFNPGTGQHAGRSRFAFFGEPPVPVLYAAADEAGAVFETILHDRVPRSAAPLAREEYRHKQLSRLIVTRRLRVAALHGANAWALGVRPEEVIHAPASRYQETVRWSAAAHAAGFDGVSYMSRMHNTSLSYALFGGDGLVEDGDLSVDEGAGCIFDDDGAGLQTLTDICAVARIRLAR